MHAINSVADLLKRHAQTRGQQTAFSGPSGREVTYAELAQRTKRMAERLLDAGITRGGRVAVVLGNCIEAVESLYATTRAAAVGVPLDPRSSQAELATAFEKSRACVVITDSRHLVSVCGAIAANRRRSESTIIVVVGEGSECLESRKSVDGLVFRRFEDWVEQDSSSAREQQSSLLDSLGLDEPAWLHFTTGTTGQPKGVLTCQRGWMWTAVNSYIPSLRFSGADKLFWPLPLFHAFAQTVCITSTLAVGATTHLLGNEPLLDGLLEHPETTIIAGSPATYRELLTDFTAGAERLTLIRPRVCLSAGAPAPSGLSQQVEALLGIPLINHYGCTECNLIATTGPGDAYLEDSCGSPPPGVYVQIRQLTPDGRPSSEVVDGEEGEICVRTPSFMLGYDNGDSDPKLPETEDKWYRTGDLGRQIVVDSGRAQRVLYVTGRLKELIIRGGENIHPAEVEKALRICPGVVDVVVTGLPHDMLGEVPVAFIVPKATHDLDVTTLLAACRAVLPEYKVPVSFYVVDGIPHTASGKPKRLATLQLLQTGSCRPLAARMSTANLIEPLVLAETSAVCSSGLHLEELDPCQPFKMLGMNSMASVVFRDRLASLIGFELPITLVFDYPTPAEVIQYLQDRLYGAQQQPVHQEQPTPSQPQDIPANLEPIAIISMDCRYPGDISSPEDLWHVVSEGLDVTSDFPTNRDWDSDTLYNPDQNNTGTSTTRRGGFLHNMADFDARFFGMSPREALATDPQQRLLLETTHTLIERAGIAPSALRGSATGVFVGMIYSDYASRFSGPGGHESEAHLDLGSSPSVAAGRVSYAFDLKGPSMAVDAACASSLVAVHLAAASLRAGESRLAVAGGVTLMSTPRQFIAFSRQRGLSTDGRCRSYSADASGTGWSEGVGLVLLEKLSDAHRNGHAVLGLVRGSAVNSDGRSNGLTAPSGLAQQEVIRQALSRAALSPADVDVLDGHGTATRLGDPIEVHAVAAAYGQNRSTPLLLGSVKSNIGHTQAAAGIASMIKLVQSMQYGVVPASLHISKPSPHIDWSSGAVELVTEARQWPRTPSDRPRRAAVSSFGISGTNAIVILEHVETTREHEQSRLSTVKIANSFPWLLSGEDEAALRAQARAMAAVCHAKDAIDVAFSLATTRSSLSHRAAVTGTSDELHAALLALAEGQSHAGVSTGLARSARTGRTQAQSKLAFLFSGQGSQRPGMGQQLCAMFPVFNAAFREVCEELDTRLERPLSEVISSPCKGDPVLLNRADFAQAAVFAFEVAMYRLLASFDIHPDYVAGHSLGEITAAHISGILSLPDAANLVAARGSLMAVLPEGGAMASISATEEEASNAIRALNQTTITVVAAVNSQDSVVVSGPTESVLSVKDVFTALERPATRLRVSHAFHSPMMEPVLDALRLALSHLSPSPKTGSPTIPLISTVTGKLATASDLTAEYWVRHVVAPVRFADAITTLSNAMRVATFVEIGPSSPLANYVPSTIVTSGSKENEVDLLLRAMSELWIRGVQPAWNAVFQGSGARVVDLPVYPFQRQRYWLEAHSSKPALRDLPLNNAAVSSNGGLPNGIHKPLRPEHPVVTPPSEAGESVASAFDDQLRKLPTEKRYAALLGLVQDEVAGVLGFQARGDVPARAWEAPLTELGFDSVLGILLRNRLGKRTGVTLPPNFIFSEVTGTAVALVEYLLARVLEVRWPFQESRGMA